MCECVCGGGGKKKRKRFRVKQNKFTEKKKTHKVSQGRTVQILKVTEQNKKSRLTLESELAAG